MRENLLEVFCGFSRQKKSSELGPSAGRTWQLHGISVLRACVLPSRWQRVVSQAPTGFQQNQNKLTVLYLLMSPYGKAFVFKRFYWFRASRDACCDLFLCRTRVGASVLNQWWMFIECLLRARYLKTHFTSIASWDLTASLDAGTVRWGHGGPERFGDFPLITQPENSGTKIGDQTCLFILKNCLLWEILK